MYTQSGSTFFIPFDGNEEAIKRLKAGEIKKWDITGFGTGKEQFVNVYQFFRSVTQFKGGDGVIAIQSDPWGTGPTNKQMKVGYEGHVTPEMVELKMGDVETMSQIFIK